MSFSLECQVFKNSQSIPLNFFFFFVYIPFDLPITFTYLIALPILIWPFSLFSYLTIIVLF